jgi:hypothetical protein
MLVNWSNVIKESHVYLVIMHTNLKNLHSQELENPIPVHITESCNQVLLSMRGNNLNMAFETINQVLSRNTHYEELLSVHFLKDLEWSSCHHLNQIEIFLQLLWEFPKFNMQLDVSKSINMWINMYPMSSNF